MAEIDQFMGTLSVCGEQFLFIERSNFDHYEYYNINKTQTKNWKKCVQWLFFPAVTVDGKPCIVPFEYDGEEYEGCKMKDGVSYCPVWENCTEGECGEEDWPEEAWGICKHSKIR